MVKPAPKNKGGRPKGERPPLGTYTFRVDDATIAAIEKLAGAMPAGTVAPRATAVRKALIESAARLMRGES